LEYRRRLAVQRVREGYSTQEVADFLGVNSSSVRRWLAAFQQQGTAGLAAQPVPGRPPKLTAAQEKIVLRWLDDCPTEHGFATDLWTAGRLAQLIDQEWGITLNQHYLCAWLRQRGYTPQKPQRVPRERDDAAIAAWLTRDWPRIKKRRAGGARTCCCWTRAGC
jgi:transposase